MKPPSETSDKARGEELAQTCAQAFCSLCDTAFGQTAIHTFLCGCLPHKAAPSPQAASTSQPAAGLLAGDTTGTSKMVLTLWPFQLC